MTFSERVDKSDEELGPDLSIQLLSLAADSSQRLPCEMST